MARLSPLELSFFALDSPSRPMHAGAVMLFDAPAGRSSGAIVERIVAAFRAADPVAPWNLRPVFGLGSLPHWETVPDVDLDHHIRRVALPAPGSMDQLMELVSDLYPPLLDRSRPLWEAYVIDGLEHRRMAVFVKAHHAMADGVGGLRMFHGSLSEAPGSDPRPLWAAAPEPGPRRRTSDEHGGGSVVSKATAIARTAPKLASVIPAVLQLARTGPLPFSAARTPTMGARTSAARSFATLDLPLVEVQAIGKYFGGTVNDVVLSVCDDAMQRYMRESGGAGHGRMVSVVPVSTRRIGDESASNAVAATLVALGAPEATPKERLSQVVSITGRVKRDIRRSPSLALALQTVSLMAAMELREQLPIGRGLVPNVANFTVSNISGGPREALFLGDAKLSGFYVTPIVGPSQAANFTVLSCQDSLCLGIGAARSIIPDTGQLARLARISFDDLSAGAAPANHAQRV